MDLEEYRKDFLEAVKSQAAAEHDLTQSAFMAVAAQRLMEAEELQDFEPCFHEGNGIRDRRLRLRVDGYSFDESDCSWKLLIAHYLDGPQAATLTQTEATTLFSRLRAFISEAMSGLLHPELENSSPAYALASNIFQNRQLVTRFRLFLITDAQLSSRVKDWPGEKVNEVPIEFHIWDVARFHRAFESSTGRDELEINFHEFLQKGVPCLEASQASGEYKAYLCVLPATILADLYDRYGSRLLERNVRSFLGIRGTKSVNSGIRSTILSQPEMFFAYNNGIAATANNVQVIRDGNGLCIVKVDDLQIVNGGQTTASLAAARRRDQASLENIFVQMKLSVIAAERADTIIPQISRSANSQNKVSDADFFSNHPFHIRMETLSRRIWAPASTGAQHETHWFYERARGQYLNEQTKLTPAAKRSFLQQNPREHLITKTDLAKYENAWRCIPHIVSLGAQKNFREYAGWIDELWKMSDENFNEEYFRIIISKAILWKYTENIVSRQQWYQGGYRANIVAYSIAKLSSLVGETGKVASKVIDFHTIWNQQKLSNALIQQIEVIAEAIFNVITSQDRPIDNVTEWCKKKYCWENVDALGISLLPAFRSELVAKKELINAAKEAKKIQNIDNGINAQTEVIALGSKYWQQLMAWAQKRRMLAPEEEKALTIASRIPSKIPTDWQCRQLLSLRMKVESQGFSIPDK